MSQAVYGAYFIEDRSCKGSTWTEEDERRLRGQFVVRTRQGPRLADPHVMCLGAPFFIGTVPLAGFAPLSGADCRSCARPRVKPRRIDGAPFCFGCGALQ